MNEKIKIIENSKNQHLDDFYQTFKEKLQKTHTFPSDYTFKFIIPSKHDEIAKLYSIFENSNASFSTRDSKNGKYLSLTVKVPVNDVEDIVIYYRQAAMIDGIMML